MVSLNSSAEMFAKEAHNLPAFKNFSLAGVKENVANILYMIGQKGIFSTYTKHDISHVDEMLNMLDWLIPPSTQKEMTPIDWLLTTLSIYLHDLGMVVTSEEYNHRMKNPNFVKFLESLDKDADGRDYLARTESMSSDEKDIFFYQEFVRMQHAARIREWITGRHSSQWGIGVKSVADEIKKNLEHLPSRFRENLATVCDSHHKDNLEQTVIFPLCQRYGSNPNELANVQYSALLLRTTDLLHITKDRTPSVMYKIIHISDPKGVEAWQKHIGTFSVNMKPREFDPDNVESHVVVVGADFTEERPFFALTEYLAYADEQIIQSKRWADLSQKTLDGKKYFFPWRAVEGNILVEGNDPVKMKFELDRGRLLNLLVGHTIYNEPTIAVRELLQNAIDAVRFQHHLDEKEAYEIKASMGKVCVKWNPEERELLVEDDGTGMDLDIIKYHLMRVGSSFYDDPKFLTEHEDFTPISRFGIGILTCFMISDDIEIITCKQSEGHRIRMSSVHADYLLKKLELGHPSLNGLEPHGTRVRLRIRSSVDLKEKTMLDIVRYWIILPACKVLYFEKGKEPQPIGFNTPSEALHYYLNETLEKTRTEDSNEILNLIYNEGNENYELAFAVRKGYTPEKNFTSIEKKKSIIPPAVCIEGIRADNSLPGYSVGLWALLSSKGNKRFRTTVSRTNLEHDEEYIRVGEICTKLLFDHLENEVNRISEQTGKPLSQASTAGLWIYKSLNNNLDNQKLRNFFDNRYSKLRLLVIEVMESKEGRIKTSRELTSPEQLKKIERFWTIESRLVDYIGILSRDLGKELSLNEFLGNLAPEFQDSRITPVLSDAHQFGDLIMSSHTVNNVEFSREHQQTLVEWKLKKDDLSDVNIPSINEIYDSLVQKLYKRNLLETHQMIRHLLTLKSAIVIAPIKGDMTNVCGINTRVITILEPKSKAAEILETLNQANLILLKEKKLSDFYILYLGNILFSIVYKNLHKGRLEFFRRSGESRNYSPIWNETFSQINSVFTQIGINKKIPENMDYLIEEIVSEGTIFNASSYWMNWIDGSYDEANIF